MAYKDPQKALEYGRSWYHKNKDRARKVRAVWKEKNKRRHAEYNKQRNAEVKLEVLSHYGPNGHLQCSWPDCSVIDPDMLSLDHVNNDGAKDRKTRGTGGRLYSILRTNGLPDGFQTLCHNHQWKKELMRRRGEF
jgi:hypothetical protein